MNGKPPPVNEDHDLEQIARVYRELGADEPPELLDQAVLNRARRASEKRHWSWNLGWYHTVGTAAGVLLAVGVYLQMRDEAPGLPPPAEPMLRDAVQFENKADRASQLGLEAEMQADDERKDRREVEKLEQDDFSAPASEDMAARAPAPVNNEAAAPATDADKSPQVEGVQARRAKPMKQTSEERLPSADQWFQHLQTLRDSGQEAAFLEQLEAFRRAYPDYELPEDWPD